MQTGAHVTLILGLGERSARDCCMEGGAFKVPPFGVNGKSRVRNFAIIKSSELQNIFKIINLTYQVILLTHVP